MGFGEQWAEAKAVKNAVLGDKEYRGPRGNISQGGGAFLNHPENKVSERAKRIPGYQGHRPYANVVSAPLQVTPRMMAARGGTLAKKAVPFNAFEQPPIQKSWTHGEKPKNYVVPGYSGWVAGAQASLGETACRLPSPQKQWNDKRAPYTPGYDNRNYRAEVNGIVPGYRGHIPGGMRRVGSSNYGGIGVRANVRGVQRYTQSRLADDAHRTPARPKSARGRIESPLDVPKSMTLEQAMSDATIAPMAAGIMRRSGGMVPRAAAFAAVRTALRGDYMRKQHENKLEAEAKDMSFRLKTQSGIVQSGLTPGYKGHVPHHREEVGMSPYKGRGTEANPLGVPAAFAPRSAFMPPSASTPNLGDVVQVV